MKRIIVPLILLAALAAQADDTPLVKAAKSSKKKKAATRVITNADVKKSGGKLVEIPPVTPDSPPAGAAAGLTQEQFESQKKARGAAAQRVAAAQGKVTDLEKELARVEQSYYDSDNPNDRDTTIASRFEQTKKQLAAARQELAEARDVLEAVMKPKP